jgi:hypothetical protein
VVGLRQTINGLPPPPPNAVRGAVSGVAAQPTAMPPRAAVPQRRRGLGDILADMHAPAHAAQQPSGAAPSNERVLGRARWQQAWGLPRQVTALMAAVNQGLSEAARVATEQVTAAGQADAATAAHWLQSALPGAIKSVVYAALEGVAAAGATACLVGTTAMPLVVLPLVSLIPTTFVGAAMHAMELPAANFFADLVRKEFALTLNLNVAGMKTWLTGAAAAHAAVHFNQGRGPVTRHLAQGAPARRLITDMFTGCVYAGAPLRRALLGGDGWGGTAPVAQTETLQTTPPPDTVQWGSMLVSEMTFSAPWTPQHTAREVDQLARASQQRTSSEAYQIAMEVVDERHMFQMEYLDIKTTIERSQKILDEAGDHDLKAALLHRQEVLDEVGHHEWFLPHSNEYKNAVDELMHAAKGTRNRYRVGDCPQFESTIQLDVAKVADEAILYVRGAKSKFTATPD